MTGRGTPKWQIIVPIVLMVAILGFIYAVYVRSGNTNAAVNATNASSDRRDCVTSVQNARRSVFDNVDIYKAIQIEQLSTVLLNAQTGAKATPADVDAFRANDLLLRQALIEARRLQPPTMLDKLIAQGGMVDGVHYEACPA